MEPRLLVVVDTEEDWFEDHARPVTVDNIAALPETHARIFDPLGVKPVYLVNWPVATGDRSAGVLRELSQAGVCEVGAHVHNWTSPPFTEEDVRTKSYHTDIDRELEKRKIADVRDAIERNIGVTPRSFKGGRWGVDTRTLSSLSELGFLVDTSVCPLTDYGELQGPDFFLAPFGPYFPSAHDLLEPHEPADPGGSLLELPVSIGFTSGDYRSRQRLMERLRKSAVARRLHAIGLLYRAGVLRRVKLSQETSSFEQMRALIDAWLARGLPQVHMTFHSNVLAVGTSPYSMTERERDERNDHMARALAYAVRERGVAPATTLEFREAWLAERDATTP